MNDILQKYSTALSVLPKLRAEIEYRKHLIKKYEHELDDTSDMDKHRVVTALMKICESELQTFIEQDATMQLVVRDAYVRIEQFRESTEK